MTNQVASALLTSLLQRLLFVVAVLGWFWVLADAEALYQTRCATCHDNPAIESPSRENIEQMGRSRLAFSLREGKMQIYTQEMSADEVTELIDYLAKEQEQTIDSYGFCKDLPISSEVVVSHWGLDHRNTRYQTKSSINSSNVGSLQLKWVFGIPNTSEVRSYPAVSTDTIFLPTTSNSLYAIDRDLGCIKWVYTNSAPFRTSAHLATIDDQPVIAVGDQQMTYHLVNALTGEKIWQKPLALFPVSMATGAPAILDNDLYIPISSFEIAVAMNPRYSCCTSHGAVTKLNALTGEQLWLTRTVREAKKTKLNKVGTQMYGPSGAPVWTSPAIDIERNQLYIGTGENTSSPATDKSDAILALDLDTGAINWVFQATPKDAFNMACGRWGDGDANCPDEKGPDFDFGGSPVIVTTPKGKDLILAGQKSGDVWALNPDNGELVWRRKLSPGSALGGIHWGTAVVDNVLVVPVADPWQVPGHNPGVFGLDIETGNILWEQKGNYDCPETSFFGNNDCERPHRFSAATSAVGDIAFAGSLKGDVYAIRASDGEIVWEYQTNQEFDSVNAIDAKGGSIDNPGVAIAGSQVMVLSGYGQFGQEGGNALLMFELP